MVDSEYADRSRVTVLELLDPELDRRYERRIISPNELRRLLEATAAAKDHHNMGGYERCLIYRLAAETGLRANELRTLKKLSFDFEECQVTVKAKDAKATSLLAWLHLTQHRKTRP